MQTPVIWRDVEPHQYETAGTFTVEGRAIGQAAGYIEAEVVVGGAYVVLSDSSVKDD